MYTTYVVANSSLAVSRTHPVQTRKSAAIDAMAAALRSLRVHGSAVTYHHERVGGNFRLDALQAAVLQAKLPYLDLWNERRRAVAARYGELLGGLARSGRTLAASGPSLT